MKVLAKYKNNTVPFILEVINCYLDEEKRGEYPEQFQLCFETVNDLYSIYVTKSEANVIIKKLFAEGAVNLTHHAIEHNASCAEWEYDEDLFDRDMERYERRLDRLWSEEQKGESL